MTTKALALLLSVASLHAVSSGDIAAQDRLSEANPERREKCRAAAVAVDSRRGATEVDAAVHELSLCDETGGEVLARVWRSGPQRSEILRNLTHASQGIRDVRLLNAVLDVASDETAGTDQRMSALTVLATYVDSRISRKQETEVDAELERFALFRSPHAGFRVGSHPFAPGHERRILDELGRIATSTHDEKIGLAADFLARRLARFRKPFSP